MRISLGGSEPRAMGKPLLIAMVTSALACAHAPATLGWSAICAPTAPPPSAWRETRISGSTTTLRIPPSYHEDVNGWMGPDSSTIRILRRPRRPPPPPGDYVVTGPVCTEELGGHVVGLSMWMEYYPVGHAALAPAVWRIGRGQKWNWSRRRKRWSDSENSSKYFGRSTDKQGWCWYDGSAGHRESAA
jgi:hypothetical protein